MKKRSYITLFLLLPLLCSCNQEDKLSAEQGSLLELEIRAEDFLPANNANTRITEGGTGDYVTSFSDGDMIGITVLKGGKIVDGMDNIPYTYTSSTGKWTASTDELFYYPDAEYIAYYPYNTAMDGKKTIAGITTAHTTYALSADQSDYDRGYAASCLMTATGTANATTKKLSLTFAHAMAMLELQLKQILNGAAATTVMADAGSTLTVASGGTNYTFNTQTTGTRYRMMLKPGATVDFSFDYSIGKVSYTYTATGLPMPAAGKYVHYDLKHVQSSVTLNTGDYEAALGEVTRVVIDGSSCPATKLTSKTYQVTIPGNDIPAAISKMDVYIKDNLANTECLLVASSNVSIDSSTDVVSVTLSKGGMEGAGTSAADPYRVTTPPQLRGVGVTEGTETNAGLNYYEQKKLLDLSVYTNWSPVKSGLLYDGKHYKIINLISTIGGVFSRNGGTIQNVHLASGDIHITSGSATGGIVNFCDVNGINQKILNCSNSANITSSQWPGVGGIVGNASYSIIEHCKNSGKITSNGNASGGVFGHIWGEAHIRYCYNEGIIAGSPTGGIGGQIYSNAYGIDYSYNMQTNITSTGEAGSILGAKA